MKAIVLAGGFAKRLWPMTKENAKPLIHVGGKPVINHIIEELLKLKRRKVIDEIFVSTNKKFEPDFQEWLEKYKFGVNLIVEETRHEGEKLGAIGGIQFLIDKEGLDDDVIVIGGDNVFDDKFKFSKAIKFFREKGGPVLCGFDVQSQTRAKLYGIFVFDENNKITDFEEKPEEPKSTIASMACYIYTKETVKLIRKYLDEGNSPDMPGQFHQWLIKKQDTFMFPTGGVWFDIGDFGSLKAARDYKRKK